MQLDTGTRIYYTGDMANDDGFGTITRQETSRWGTTVDITMDDGRQIRGLSIRAFSTQFSGNASTRFVTVEAYQAWRTERLAMFAAT